MSLKAVDIMSTNLITMKPEADIRELAEVLVINKISGVPVVDEDGILVGVVSQSDLVAQNKNPRAPSAVTLFDWVIYLESMDRLKAELDKMAGSTVGEIMTRKVITVAPETMLEELATIMSEKNVHTLPVVDKGKLVGVIGKLDIVRSLLQ